ncbi:MAG: sugar ABC transporter substrate-binding protein [Clostridiales bacterium]|nr:sugar ABC transporter substrate-binding protein [Clostridiales bacterium]
MKKIVGIILALALLASLTAFAEETIRIGGIPADDNIEFFQRLAAGMAKAGEDLGITVDIQFTGRSVEEELRLTEYFIAQGYDGIVLETVDSAAITGCAVKAAEAGLKFVAVDTVPERLDLMNSTVTSDNYEGGVQAGKLMKQLLPDGGDVIMVTFAHSSIATDERYQGFEAELAGSNITIVDRVATDGSRDDAVVKVAPMLTQYPDIDGIFCCQGDPAIGVLTAVTTAGLEEQVKILAYDIEGEVAAAIKGGTAIVGGVAQFPYEMGYLSIVQCYKAIKGEPTEQIIKLPVLQVSAEAMEKFTGDTTAYLKEVGGVDIFAY